ncbi:MAG: type VI secretion system baseplate subunit TssG [Planctomycetota bacterium]
MADHGRTTSHRVDTIRRLAEEPFRFGFFQALRRLECELSDRPRIGRSLRAADDALRLAQEPSMAFAPSTLASFTPGRENAPSRLAVYFFGLLGPNGPMPLHLTEYARDRIRNHDDLTFSRFLDLFHHRMLSLFYRSWADAQPTVSFDRPDDDRFTAYVGSLFGQGTPEIRNRDAAPDHAKLHFSGRLVCQTRHAEGLEALIGGFFRMPVAVEEFVGQWLELPEESRCRLGESTTTCTLGRTLIVGARLWDCQQRFRIRLGPTGFRSFLRMLPGSASGSMDRLVALVRSYVGDELVWDVSLVLKKEEVPPLGLDGTRQLGYTTWLTSGPREKDSDDLTLEPLAEAF